MNAKSRTALSPGEAAKRYRTLPSDRYDLVVMGGGAAGLSAAELGAALGGKVALLDREKLGGECLYTGCVPSKALLQVASIAQHVRAAPAFGLDAQLGPVDLDAVMGYVRHTISQVYHESDNPERYVAMGVDVAFGETRFVAPDRLSVNGQEIIANRALICAGSRPTVPTIPGLERANYLTNETIFDLKEAPERLAVLGGGPAGCEFGQAFARLGSKVTIFQRPARLLPRDEPEAARMLQAALEAEGVTINCGAEVTDISYYEGAMVVSAARAGDLLETSCDELLVTLGRTPNVNGLGLEAAGVRYDARRGIEVDRQLRTSNPHVFAAGDVIGGYIHAHAAALEARAAVRNALFPGGAALDARVMPWTTFTDPEVAQVGLTEAQARARHGASVRVYEQRFERVDRAITSGTTNGFARLVSGRDGKLLGASLVGPAAGEYINELALALRQNLSLADLAATTHVYPTLALAIQQAAGQFSLERAIRSPTLRLLRRRAR